MIPSFLEVEMKQTRLNVQQGWGGKVLICNDPLFYRVYPVWMVINDLTVTVVDYMAAIIHTP